jgi:type II secretory ATPase GspE/PulE/Tfp pilus assembly ATPase PilB-like protein
MLTLQPGPLQRAILSRGDAPRLEQLAKSAGMLTRWQRAHEAVEAGLTSPVEVRRVLGFSDAKAAEQPG